MIAIVSPTKGRHGSFALPLCMPAFRRGDAAAWLGALPQLKGEVSVQGTVATDVRIATTDVYGTTPGNPAWSPPIQELVS